MKFTPVELHGNLNVSKTHPLIELLWLLGGVVVLVGLIFVLLGVTADWAVSKTPPSIENWLGEMALQQFPAEENKPLERRLQGLIDSLPAASPLHQYHFHVFLDPSNTVNAIALPGGNIVVYKGLLTQVKSENELAMVLAHELGHFAHRDHLRSLGRGLGVALATTLIFGEGSAVSNLAAKTLLTFQTRYSRQQEAAADQFGLDLLERRYGHAGGSVDFFRRIEKDAGGELPYLLASHPHPRERIDALKRRINTKHYRLAATEPLHNDLIRTRQ